VPANEALQNAISPAVGDAPAPDAAKTIEHHMWDAIPTESCFQGFGKKFKALWDQSNSASRGKRN
jgi:hypothetical protein